MMIAVRRQEIFIVTNSNERKKMCFLLVTMQKICSNKAVSILLNETLQNMPSMKHYYYLILSRKI